MREATAGCLQVPSLKATQLIPGAVCQGAEHIACCGGHVMMQPSRANISNSEVSNDGKQSASTDRPAPHSILAPGAQAASGVGITDQWPGCRTCSSTHSELVLVRHVRGW